jgi:GH18 family chitinase
MGSTQFSEMAGNSSKRNIFIKTSIQFLQSRKFDGLGI